MVDKEPKFQFAIFSRRDGCELAELECSCAELGRARRFLTLYEGWGFTDVTFYLVNWENQELLGQARYVKA
jgi:hypothetical protein